MLLFPDLPFLKLVEPGRDEGVVRVGVIPSTSWLSRAATKERPVSKPVFLKQIGPVRDEGS